MQITITRQHMIDAARTEPLSRGAWVYYDARKHENYFGTDECYGMPALNTPEKCPVCAVGGAFRQAGVGHPDDIDQVCNTLPDFGPVNTRSMDRKSIIDLMLTCGHYLNALSIYFESGDWKTRDDLVAWIETNVPADYQQDFSFEEY